MESVLNENRNIFNSFPNIFADIISIAQSQNIIMIQIIVNLSHEESIEVIDVLEVEGSKISKIRAYKG
jgi:hypothetical protein|tara:strand:+ start:737 stop:940 length:204 start_codon:yes stop_codon:yes gene_type:complete